jgi:hypothetical protein
LLALDGGDEFGHEADLMDGHVFEEDVVGLGSFGLVSSPKRP